MKRMLPACLLILACTATAAPPAATSAPSPATDAAAQQRMAALQTRMNALAARMAALSAKLGDEANASALRYLADSRRGMLGMALSPAGSGLRVYAVTPGGPAEGAGVKAGDVITAVDGKPVQPDDAAAVDRLSNAPIGTPLALTIERGGNSRKVHITPERLQRADWQDIARQAELAASEATARVRSPEFREQIQQSIDEAMKSAAVTAKSASAARDLAVRLHGPGRAWIVRPVPWFGLNLAPLNPGLGRYFGADRGVLVLSRNDKQFPKLQPGDVITGVGGKSVAQPEDVLRALRNAPDDAHVRLALRRHGKDVAVTMKAPPRWNMVPPPPPPPAPPAPPAPTSPNAPAAPPPPAPPAPPPSSAAHAR